MVSGKGRVPNSSRKSLIPTLGGCERSSGAQGISTNVALPKGGLLGYNDYYDGEVEGKGDDDYDADDKDDDDDDGDDNDDDAQSKY